MKNENPCENCLIKVICMTPCNELNNFAKQVLSSRNLKPTTWHNCWIEKYECRPRIIELKRDLLF